MGLLKDSIVSGSLRVTDKIYGDLKGNADTATTATTATSATSATTATKLGSSNVGSATQPIYLNGGTPTATTYTLGKSVPSDAVFTDNNTTYAAGTGITISGTDNKINVSYGTAANTACQGNDSRLSNARPSSDVVNTYSATGTVPISGTGVAAALGTLDGTVSGSAGAGKTLTAFSQTDGKVSATFGNISITKSQVSDFPSSLPASDTTSTYSSTGTAPVNGTAVAQALATLPAPMVFKGTVGTNGTITTLPVNGTATVGDTYKVITAGTYASQAAKVGDVFTCLTKTLSANTWAYIPSGDETDSDTWRNIKINGTEKLGSGISTGAVDFVNGTNTTVSYNATGNKISINATDTNTHRPIQVNGTQILGDNTTALNLKAGDNVSVTNSSGTVTIAATDTTYESKTAASGGTDVSLVTTGEKYTWNNKSDLTLGTTATTAAKGNHTHATSIATSTGTNQITLAANTKYSITAGGTSYVFTTPPDTNTTYTASTTSIGSASAGTAIPADDITAWTTNTPTSCVISEGVLTFTAGTAASLSYTAKSIPNISVTSTTVATGITAS